MKRDDFNFDLPLEDVATMMDTGAPTWTDVYTFSSTVSAVCELRNGELMVAVTSGGTSGAVYISNGWPSNPATATPVCQRCSSTRRRL